MELHTQFPEYIRLRYPIPLRWSYAYLRWFHSAVQRTLVPTRSIRDSLVRRGFDKLVVWSRGVDVKRFQPTGKTYLDAPRPISLYVGRVAVEKNLEAFLSLDLPGSKFVVGDGPDLERLRSKYPAVTFSGPRQGEDLVHHVSAADVFVFPSRTDTFGLVLLEAMACGVPVAAYPVGGPIDVVQQGVTGWLSNNLREAVMAALSLSPDACINYARQQSWRACAHQFLESLQPGVRRTDSVPGRRRLVELALRQRFAEQSRRFRARLVPVLTNWGVGR